MEKILKIGGKDVKMRASALIPKLYRYKFGRDMIQDMTALTKSYRKVKELPEDATEEEDVYKRQRIRCTRLPSCWRRRLQTRNGITRITGYWKPTLKMQNVPMIPI